jgi:hypothetical protein
VWIILFLFYVVGMLCLQFKRGIPPAQANEAAWGIAYVMLPVITAFASFFFAPLAQQHTPAALALDKFRIDGGRVYVMVMLTAVFDIIVMVYCVINVFVPDWKDERNPRTFDEAFSFGIKLLVFLSSLAVIPVGWVLNPIQPPPPPPPPSAQDPLPPSMPALSDRPSSAASSASQPEVKKGSRKK